MNSVAPRSGRFPSFQQWSPIGVLAGGIFLIDLLIPLGVATGILYIAVILLSLRHRDSQLPLWTAVGCSILTLTAFFISPVAGELWKVLMNRGLALFAIWTTTLMGRVQLQQATTNHDNLLLTDRVFMASHEHISVLGQDYRYRRVNPSYEKIHGKENKDVIGMSVSDLLGKEIFEKTVKPKLDTCFQGKEVNYEAWFRFADNQDHYMSVSYLPLISGTTDVEEIVVIAKDLTERKKSEETIQRQALMFNTVYDGLLTTDLKGNITDWNPGAEQMFGYSKDEALGCTPAFLHQPSESTRLTQSIIEELTQKGRWQGEINFLKKNGISGVCETIVVPLMNSDGQAIGTIGVNRDITERKRTEKQFATIAKGISSSTGKDFFCSFVEQLTIALDIDYAIIGEYLEKDSPSIGTIAAYGKGARLDNFEYELLNTPCQNVADGSFYACPQHVNQQFPLDMLLKDFGIQGYAGLPLIDSSGRILGLILALHQKPLKDLQMIESTMNIFATRALAELERKQAEEVLKSSEERFRTYFETGLIGMAMTSAEQEWLEVNEQFCELLGYSREELTCKTWAELTYPDDLPLDQANFESMRAGTRSSYTTSKRYIRKDGALMYANLYVNALRKPSGQIKYYTAMIEDITEQKLGEALLMKWAMIFQHTQWGVAVSAGASTNFEMVNEAYARMHGYAIRELEGMSVADVVTPEFRIQLPNIIEKIHQDGFLSYEAPHIRKDGNTFPALVTESAIKDINGQTLYRITNVIDISDLKSVEDALKNSEERLSVALEASSSGTWDWNVLTGEVIFGKEWLKSLGYQSQDLQTTVESWKNLVHPDDMPMTLQAINKHFSGETPVYESINRLRMKNGEWRWNLDRGRVVEWTTDGKPLRMVGTDTDITARKEAERLLQDSQAWIAGIVDIADDAMIAIDETQHITLFNQGAEKIFGYAATEILGQSLLQLLPQRFVEHHHTHIHTFAKSTESARTMGERSEVFGRRKDGQEFPAEASISRLHSSNGTTFTVILRDVTEHKRAQQASAQLAAIVVSSKDAIMGKDLNGTINYWNQSAERLFGYTAEEAIGQNKSMLLPHDRQSEVADNLSRIRQGEIIQHFETLRRHKDGTLVNVALSISPVRDETGTLIGASTIARDITERKQVEVALDESRNRFRAIFDNAGIGMALVDDKGHPIETNRSFQAFLGYNSEELAAISFVEFTHDEDSHEHWKRYEELKAGARESFNLEKRYIKKDGEIVWGHLTTTAIRHANGQLKFAIGMVEDITKKKLSEELLTKWATIFQHTQWGVAVGNANSHNLDLVNEAYARMHGYTIEELLGQPIAKVFAPSFRPQLPAFIQKIHEEGFQSIESLHIRKDGTTFPALLTVSAVKDSQGEVLYRVANLIDISDRKADEESLQESEQRFRSMFEQAAVGVAQVDSNTGDFIRINQRYCDIVEHTQEEMMRMKFQDITHPADQPADLKHMKLLLSGELNKFSLEKRYVRKNGSIVWIHLTVSPMWLIGEKPSHHIAVVEDITERKMAKEALEQSERLANSTMNALTAQLCVLDESGQILSTNERWDQFARDNHGDPTKLGIGINYVTVCVQAAKKGNKEAELFLSGLNAVLSKQQSEFSMDYQCSSPRQIRWYSARVTRFPDPGPVRVVVSHSDITEQKSLEEAIRKQNEELETTVAQRTARIVELEQRRMQVEKLAALAQIAAGVAHEINNPLASISQSLVLLKRALPTDHPHFRYMAKTEDCVQRIAAITKNLYQLYLPSGPIPTLVDIRKCIQTATEIMEERSAKRGIRIKDQSHSTPIMTHIAQSELIQVLCNLIHNAIDASDEGATIEISLTTGSKALFISIADKGEGISPEAATHIFEPFYTTKQNGSEGGMGLGLSISHSLVESMKGSLDFSTALGQGSTFVITLPRI